MIKFVSDLPGRWFSPLSSTNETNCHDITDILLKITLNTINSNPISKKYRRVFKMFKGKGHRWMPISTNISIISSRSVLLVEYLNPVKNNWPAASHRQTLLPGDIFECTSQTLCQNQNQTYNFSCDRHQLHG